MLIPALFQQVPDTLPQDTLQPDLTGEFESPSFFHFEGREVEVISAADFQGEDRIIYIRDQWKFMPGDDPAWADPDFDDASWDVVSTNLSEADLSFIEWEGIGWFRKQLMVEPDLAGKPVALIVDRHLGASEIYLNGEKVIELGTFSDQPEKVEAFSPAQPLVIVFSGEDLQTIAVRFINPDYALTGHLLGMNGFRFLLGDWTYHQSQMFSYLAYWTGSNMFYIGVLLAFSLMHLMLFFFYPVEKRNLYFSLFVGGLVLIAYLYYKLELASFTFDMVYFFRFMMVSEVIVLAFATRFTHSLDRRNSPAFANTLLAGGFVIAGLVWMFPGALFPLRDLAIAGFLIEILRSLFMMMYRRRSGIWVLGSGVFIFVIGLITSILINFDVIAGSAPLVNMASSGALILSMSVFLARDFAATQTNLEHKLSEVQELSKRALRQEKINKEREIEKRLLEAENRRKTAELEEARALQLSMLPQKMPSVGNLDISVYMQTATEVGGDYYDYSLGPDGTLVLALGDATGHGMKAGIMVAAAKSYFHTLVHETDNLTMLHRISSGLKNLNMRLMYMGLILVHCRNNELDITSAGMPPVLHYSHREGQVNRITVKGLPLGGKASFPYRSRKISVCKGDLVVLMSDGLIELFNAEREMFGISRIEETLRNANGYAAGDVINQLKQQAESWKGSAAPHDDITLMVLKVPG